MSKQFSPEGQPADDQTPKNRAERRKKRLRPEEDSHFNRAQISERLRDTPSRATFVRRLGPR